LKNFFKSEIEFHLDPHLSGGRYFPERGGTRCLQSARTPKSDLSGIAVFECPRLEKGPRYAKNNSMYIQPLADNPPVWMI